MHCVNDANDANDATAATDANAATAANDASSFNFHGLQAARAAIHQWRLDDALCQCVRIATATTTTATTGTAGAGGKGVKRGALVVVHGPHRHEADEHDEGA